MARKYTSNRAPKVRERDEAVRHARLPACPTDALPGTPDKVEILRQRFNRGEALHHPADVTDDLGRAIAMEMHAGNFARKFAGVIVQNAVLTVTKKHIGIRICSLREQAGWTRKQLSRRSGICVSMLSRLENGSRTNPTLGILVALADAFGVTMDRLIGRTCLQDTN